jgi:hypothetical protein
LVLYLLFNKKINAKKAKIQEKEGVLNENKNEQLVKKAMDEATSEAYSISNFNDSKRYIIIFLILIMTLIYMYLSNQISINFLIFHFFFYSFLDESIVKIIDYIDSINEYRFHKCLYLNYCKEE